jgi:hypothetical protein
MSVKAKRIQTVDVELTAQPGALARVFSGFKEAGVNVIASWGYEMGPNQAQAHFYVSDLDKTTSTLKQMGLKPKKTDACWMEGDEMGAYAEVLNKIGKAGVNIGATDAFAVGSRFASVIFPKESKDYAALCKALNI